MTIVRCMAVAAAAALVSVASLAQGMGGGPKGSGPGPAASAPGPGASMPGGMGMGGQRGGRMHHARSGPGNTPGWSLMTPQERDAHRERMQGFKDYDECKAYVAKHHDEMVARAKGQGGKPPAQPRRDPCAPLKR